MLDQNPIIAALTRYRGLIFPCAAGALIFVILIPLPTWLLDFLLLVNILLAVVVMMTTMYIKSPLEFSSFPSMLLALTLLRLVSNTATTRLILANGGEGTDAAGEVVKTFGEFVAGGSLAVGVIIFAIIMVIQFVVITKGATRIAEVAARFTLDGMPGKQMAIDADLNAGIIDDVEAKRRRKEITAEADFFGSMDGASKFVRGDAVAGIIITFVNILGGLYVGMVEHGMELMECLEVYTKLTIGDGLASAVPAFVLSVGAGMLVTRNTAQSNMGEEVLGQLFSKPTAIGVAAAFLAILMLTPLPTLPLFTLAAGCGLMAFFVNQSQTQVAAQKVVAENNAKPRPEPEKIENQLNVDALELQIGLGLVRLVDRARGGDLLERINGVRKQMATELGIVVPPIRIRDNAALPPSSYELMLRGQSIAQAEIVADQLMAIDSGLASDQLYGTATREPAFGLPAFWIQPADREFAERRHYTVVEPTGVLATHLTELLKRHAADLLTRSETAKLVDNLKLKNQPLVDEVIPGLLKLGEVQRVLQNLLRERVPIRDLEAILESLGDWASKTKDSEILTEYARNALARVICSQYKDHTNTVHCVTFDPQAEDFIAANIQRLDQGSHLAIPPDRQSQLVSSARKQIDDASAKVGGATPVILCSPPIRLWVRRMIEPILPSTPVLGLNEIVRGVDVHAHGVISVDGIRSNVSRGVHA